MGYRTKTRVTSDVAVGQNDGRGNTAGGEMYRVRSKSNPDADYFTDDLDDAEGTAMAMAKVGAAPFNVGVVFEPFTTFRRPRAELFSQTAEEDAAGTRVIVIQGHPTAWRAGDPGSTPRSMVDVPDYKRGDQFTASASWTLMNGHPALRINVNLGARVGWVGRHAVLPLNEYVKFAYISAKSLREGKLGLLFQTNIYDRPYAELPFVLAKESVGPALVGLDDFLGRVGFSGLGGEAGVSKES